MLDGYTHHPTTRFTAGVTNATVLRTELVFLGFTGGVQANPRWLPRSYGP